MSHAATVKSFPQRAGHTRPIPRKAKVYYVIIVAALLTVAVAYVVARGIMGSVDNQAAPVQQSTNSTNPGTTENTGAPAADTGTPDDRTNPNPSGGGGNTLLNPEF